MIGLDSITLDIAGVKFDRDIDGVRCWQVDSEDGLNCFYFPIPPDLPAPVSDIDTLRSFYRHTLKDEGKALISLDAIEIDGCAATKLIVKARVPNEEHGMLYIAAITIPFRNFSFVLKTVCAELGPTGMREAMILPMYMQDGTVEITASGKFIGWCADPYDPTFQADLLRNLAEDEKYDSMVPFHPLSRARRIMQSLRDHITLSDEVKAAPVFTGPQEPRKNHVLIAIVEWFVEKGRQLFWVSMGPLWKHSGANFHWQISPHEGQCQAMWWVTVNTIFGTRFEHGDTAAFAGERAAIEWLNQEAKTHGFKPPYKL